MNFLKDFNFTGKKVLLRCGFDVPIKEGKILDDFRIEITLPTINYLKERRAKIILISHLGQPAKVQSSKLKVKNYSLKPVALHLEKLLSEKVKFLNECIGEMVKKKVEKMKEGEILLLENLRLEKGEEENDEKFAKELASLGEVYVSEAFSVCHRPHASVVTLPKLLPSVAGLRLKKEIEVLSEIKEQPKRPQVLIIGGAKIPSRIKVIERFLKKVDHLLLGGKIANVLLRVKGISLGKPWPEEEVTKIIEKLDITSPKIHLPVDVLCSPDESGKVYIRETGPGNVRKEEEIFDIGDETIKKFEQIIKTAQTLFWSGPLGLVENKNFSKGTEEIAKMIVKNYSAFKVAGGGDTIVFLKKIGLLNKFSFISSGGGAMLAFLADEKLPGIEALKT
ncbi:MAG: phosphoglycerate kinase [Patescibacteria group bacterium]|nr:phosphoglycerate kinase [Patescibacteria group bacterium]